MKTTSVFVCAALAAPTVFAGEIQVRASAGRVDLVASAAPLQDVLARLSQQTGMKVVYDGAPPRYLVNVTLQQRTPAEIVLLLFDGSGVNYALAADKSGTNVSMLIISGASSGSASPSRPLATPAPIVPNAARQGQRPQRPDDERAEERERDEEKETDDTAKPQAAPTPPAPVIFQGPIPGPGRPGSPFGGGTVLPLTIPTPGPPGSTIPQPVPPSPMATPTPQPGPSSSL